MESAPRNVQVRPMTPSMVMITWEPPETPNGQVTVSICYFNHKTIKDYKTECIEPKVMDYGCCSRNIWIISPSIEHFYIRVSDQMSNFNTGILLEN